MEPIRLKILKALTEALEEITPENGYQHDLRGSVFRGRTIFGREERLPFVSILEAMDDESAAQSLSPRQGGKQVGPWTLTIQGFVEDDFYNPTDPAHRLMADVKKRLIQERPRERQYDILGMGGKITEIRISPGVTRPAEDGLSEKAFFFLNVTLEFVEDMMDPYS